MNEPNQTDPPTAIQMIETIDKAILKIVNGGNDEIEIDGNRFSKLNLIDLRKLREFYLDIVTSQSRNRSKSGNIFIRTY